MNTWQSFSPTKQMDAAHRGSRADASSLKEHLGKKWPSRGPRRAHWEKILRDRPYSFSGRAASEDAKNSDGAAGFLKDTSGSLLGSSVPQTFTTNSPRRRSTPGLGRQRRGRQEQPTLRVQHGHEGQGGSSLLQGGGWRGEDLKARRHLQLSGLGRQHTFIFTVNGVQLSHSANI